MSEKTYTIQELKKYNGDDEPEILIAFEGVVYDVTDCPKWRSGMHEQQHYPGLDLSFEINDAPHNAEVFNRPCVKQVGILITEP